MKGKLLFFFVFSIDVLLCIAIIICNLALLLSILCCKAARSRLRNAMLVGMCLADLLVGAFTHPVYIHSYSRGTMFQSCEMHVLLQLVGDYSQDFVCFWTLVTLGGWYVYRLVGERWGWRTPLPGEYGRLSASRPLFLRRCDVVKKMLLVGWPWLAVLIIPVPILVTSVDPHTRDMFWDETFCPLHIVFPARIAVLVLVFYLPMASLAMLVAGIWLASCSSTASPQRYFSRPVDSLVERDALCVGGGAGGGVGEGVGVGSDGAGAVFTTSSETERRGGSNSDSSAGSSSAAGSADGKRNAQNSASATGENHNRNFPEGRPVEAGSASDHTAGHVIGVGRPSVSEASPEGSSDLERPLHMAVPMVVTLVCSLPLMIGWWFYDTMEEGAVIVLAVSLHRLYLLRAALLPWSWFVLPDLRKAFTSLRVRLCRWLGCRGQRGDFSVAYSTLQETRDAPTAPDAAAARGPEPRHNPFNDANAA